MKVVSTSNLVSSETKKATTAGNFQIIAMKYIENNQKGNLCESLYTKDVKLVKTNISSLHSNGQFYILTALILYIFGINFHNMALLVILFVIKLYALLNSHELFHYATWFNERPNRKLCIYANLKLFIFLWWQSCEKAP